MNSVHDVDLLEVFKDKKEESTLLGGIFFLITLVLFAIALVVLGPGKCFGAETGTASWYSYESCIKEGSSGICADGKVMKNDELSCASWFYDLESYVLVTNLENGKSVRCEVRDRGPAKRLVKKGRIIDLSSGAFRQIADLKQGIVKVSVKEAI